MKRILMLLTVTGLLLGGCSKSNVENPISLIDRSDRTPATEIAAEWLNTTENPSIAGKKGNVVLLNFWATWCGPCRMEMPGLVHVYQKFHAKGFDVLGLSVDSPDPRKPGSAAEVRNFVKSFITSNNVPYPVGLANLLSSQAYSINAIPASYLIDREGKIAAKLIGLYREEQIEDAVDRLISEKQ
jgi:thiol-disulfide isomerase/thioredoxin